MDLGRKWEDRGWWQERTSAFTLKDEVARMAAPQDPASPEGALTAAASPRAVSNLGAGTGRGRKGRGEEELEAGHDPETALQEVQGPSGVS